MDASASSNSESDEVLCVKWLLMLDARFVAVVDEAGRSDWFQDPKTCRFQDSLMLSDLRELLLSLSLSLFVLRSLLWLETVFVHDEIMMMSTIGSFDPSEWIDDFRRPSGVRAC